MSAWTAFIIGLGIGTPWLIAGIIVVIWLRAAALNDQYRDDTGTGTEGTTA